MQTSMTDDANFNEDTPYMGLAHQPMLMGMAHQHMLMGLAHEHMLMGRAHDHRRYISTPTGYLSKSGSLGISWYPGILI